MAQDITYQTVTYHEHSGDRYVAGSGGQITAESGGSIVIASAAGTLRFESGATLSTYSGTIFGLAGQNIAADDMRRILVSELAGDTVIIGQGVGSTVLSVLNLPKNVRIVILSHTSTMVSASFWLTSVSQGREVFLFGGPGSNISGQIDISTSGCTLIGSCGIPISGVEVHNSGSAISCWMLHLAAIRDNVWAIVDEYGDINE